MDREDDGHLARQGRQLRDRLRQQRAVDEGGAVQGDEHEGARLDAEPRRRAGRPEASFQRDQGVDHRVADQVDALGRDALGVQVVVRPRGCG